MEAAIESLKSLKLGEKPNYTKIAKEYGVSRTTLSRRHRGIQGTRAAKVDSMRLLNPTQENQLLLYIKGLCTRGLPPIREMIRNFAVDIVKKELGKN